VKKSSWLEGFVVRPDSDNLWLGLQAVASVRIVVLPISFTNSTIYIIV